jgi:hypothetical protein
MMNNCITMLYLDVIIDVVIKGDLSPMFSRVCCLMKINNETRNLVAWYVKRHLLKNTMMDSLVPVTAKGLR